MVAWEALREAEESITKELVEAKKLADRCIYQHETVVLLYDVLEELRKVYKNYMDANIELINDLKEGVRKR